VGRGHAVLRESQRGKNNSGSRGGVHATSAHTSGSRPTTVAGPAWAHSGGPRGGGKGGEWRLGPWRGTVGATGMGVHVCGKCSWGRVHSTRI
jgi:hypothetical protein